MTARAMDQAAFLVGAGWDDAQIAPLAGDASARRYFRLTRGDDRAVLMDADPARGEDTRPFIAMAEHLAAQNLSPPQILARAPETGFLLLEDLGDRLFARDVAAHPDQETTLYRAALDALDQLRGTAPPPVDRYDAPAMAEAAALAIDWYAPPASAARRGALVAATRTALSAVWTLPEVLVLRDYHAENLIWLPDRRGVARVGLLDFQDAMLGHPLYDPVSLLVDARRDVSMHTIDTLRPVLAAQLGLDTAAFDRAFTTICAQRCLRILGVFARLWLRDGKPAYLALLPRVWGQLGAALDHPDLAGIAGIVADTLPAPTPDYIETIRCRGNA